jgi:hypothetical protein
LPCASRLVSGSPERWKSEDRPDGILLPPFPHRGREAGLLRIITVEASLFTEFRVPRRKQGVDSAERPDMN